MCCKQGMLYTNHLCGLLAMRRSSCSMHQLAPWKRNNPDKLRERTVQMHNVPEHLLIGGCCIVAQGKFHIPQSCDSFV